MVRRFRIAMHRLVAPLGGAGLLCALAGCLGGAQPVPPALDPMAGPDADIDAARGGLEDAGSAPADAGAYPPSPGENLADFAGASSSRDSSGGLAGIDWHWRVIGPAPWVIDAGAPTADAGGPRGDAADAP